MRAPGTKEAPDRAGCVLTSSPYSSSPSELARWAGLIVLASGIAAADEIFHLVALTIIVSIVAHSSTDVPVARLFDETHETSEDLRVRWR